MTLPPTPQPLLQVSSLDEFTGNGEAVTLVVCAGALTRIDAGRLRDQLLAQLRHGPRHVLLELSEIDSIDDVAVAMITDMHRRAGSARCTFDLVAPSQPVQSRLRLTGLNRLLHIHTNLTEALTALDRPSSEPHR
jgi:anti-anti-sigma factor